MERLLGAPRLGWNIFDWGLAIATVGGGFLNRVKGAALVAAVVIGFFLATGILGTLSSTPTGVFGIVAVLAVLLILAGLFGNRR